MTTEGGMDRHRILVVDDDEVMRELLSALLDVQGHEVDTAFSGENALALLRGGYAPTLVLTDLQMPGIEGAELVSALRGEVSHSALLVGMSGSRPAEEICLSLDEFLPKPFTAEQLSASFLTARATKAHQATANAAALPSEAADAPNKAPHSGQPVLDDAIFASLCKMFQPPQLMELYVMTLQDVEERHARILAHAAAGDIAAAKREAHAIKGACGMVGARQLQHLAAETEGGTTLNTAVIADFPAAGFRLRRMLEAKLPQKW